MTKSLSISKTAWAVVLTLALAFGGLGMVAPSLAVADSGSALASAQLAPQASSKAKVKKAKSAKAGQLTIKASKTAGATGYQYKVSLNKKFTKGVKTKSSKKRSVTIKGLKKGKKYYVKVRAYAKVGGAKYWGAWSKVKTAKTKGTATYSTKTSPIAGTWEFASVSGGSQAMSADQIAQMKALGISFVVTFKKDGTATLETKSTGVINLGEMKADLTWKATGEKTGEATVKSFSSTFPSTTPADGSASSAAANSAAKLQVKGDKLLMTAGNATVTFVKA